MERDSKLNSVGLIRLPERDEDDSNSYHNEAQIRQFNQSQSFRLADVLDPNRRPVPKTVRSNAIHEELDEANHRSSGRSSHHSGSTRESRTPMSSRSVPGYLKNETRPLSEVPEIDPNINNFHASSVVRNDRHCHPELDGSQRHSSSRSPHSGSTRESGASDSSRTLHSKLKNEIRPRSELSCIDLEANTVQNDYKLHQFQQLQSFQLADILYPNKSPVPKAVRPNTIYEELLHESRSRSSGRSRHNRSERELGTPHSSLSSHIPSVVRTETPEPQHEHRGSIRRAHSNRTEGESVTPHSSRILSNQVPSVVRADSFELALDQRYSSSKAYHSRSERESGTPRSSRSVLSNIQNYAAEPEWYNYEMQGVVGFDQTTMQNSPAMASSVNSESIHTVNTDQRDHFQPPDKTSSVRALHRAPSLCSSATSTERDNYQPQPTVWHEGWRELRTSSDTDRPLSIDTTHHIPGEGFFDSPPSYYSAQDLSSQSSLSGAPSNSYYHQSSYSRRSQAQAASSSHYSQSSYSQGSQSGASSTPGQPYDAHGPPPRSSYKALDCKEDYLIVRYAEDCPWSVAKFKSMGLANGVPVFYNAIVVDCTTNPYQLIDQFSVQNVRNVPSTEEDYTVSIDTRKTTDVKKLMEKHTKYGVQSGNFVFAAMELEQSGKSSKCIWVPSMCLEDKPAGQEYNVYVKVLQGPYKGNTFQAKLVKPHVDKFLRQQDQRKLTKFINNLRDRN